MQPTKHKESLARELFGVELHLKDEGFCMVDESSRLFTLLNLACMSGMHDVRRADARPGEKSLSLCEG